MTNLVPFSLILGVAAAFILLGGGLFIRTFRFRAKAQQLVACLVKSEEYGYFREDGRRHCRIGGFIALAASRLRGQIRRIGLDQ